METPKIYVADLEAYNSGRLVGKWFDLDDYSDADELVEAIEEYMTSLGKEEYAIHDIENFPREFYSEYMGKGDFEKVYEIMEKAKEFKLPLEVVSEFAREYSIDAVDSFQDKYDDMSDFAYKMVEEWGIDSFSNPEAYMYVSETDKRIIAGEEGDNFVDNSSDKEIIEKADMDFDEYQEADEEAQEKMLEEAKDIVREQIYEEWYEGLDAPYHFLVEEKEYEPDVVKDLSFVQIDYEKLGRDLEYDYNTIQYDGKVYVFRTDYAKGGFLSRLFGGGKKEYNRSWHQDHYNVNKEESWERQDTVRHGKKARNRYEDGGQMSMFAKGGMTKNEEIMRSFLTSKGEFEVNNLSTHYNQYDDMMLLRNYYTLIATRKGNVVKITDKRYSKSTSTIVNALVRMARDMGFEVDMVTEFAKGGNTYNRSWHQDHYNVNKEESWERQDGVRHGKTARNRYAKGGEIGEFNIGQSVIIRSDNDNENYDKYRGKELVITHKATNAKEHRGYDSSMEGQGLYDFFVRKTGEKVPFSLYDYEIEQYSRGGMMHGGKHYADGGQMSMFARGGNTYNRSWHQDHYNVNKEESWERQDGVRHGKTARNRYAKGGEAENPLSYYKYSTKKVMIAFNGKIQMGSFYSADEAMDAIKKQAQTKEELTHYSIVTPDKVIHLGKEYAVRYADGGQMSMFAKGGMTKNEEIMRSFLTSKGEFEVNNLSTHYNQYDDMMLLRNYYTLIATRKGNVVKITDKRYSKSTSTIVNALVRMARDMGFEVNMVTEFAKGGKLKSYKYVPNRNIESVTLTQGEGTITIPQDNILDGVYIRKRYKAFGRGGNTGNYNEGLSWKLDRKRFAKKEDYEVQYRKHK